MTGFPINPPNAPITDGNGNCTPEWYKYFAAIQKMIGGAFDPFDGAAMLGAASAFAAETTPAYQQFPPAYFTAGNLVKGVGIDGGGNMEGNVPVALDITHPRNVDHSAVSITAGAGLTGGGTIEATRTLALVASGVTAGTKTPPASITVDVYGRVTALS